jgi:hypothetical protein
MAAETSVERWNGLTFKRLDQAEGMIELDVKEWAYLQRVRSSQEND